MGISDQNNTLRPIPEYKKIYERTVTVWGKANHDNLARLRIGIVGLGSVGSIVAESLARMGVERFVLIDFDEVQEHNLDRLLGATINDIGHLKAYIAQRQILKSATATHTQVGIFTNGITEIEGYKAALDCDVIFSCVDRPWARQVLNHIALNHLIPVIDGGIKVRFDKHTKQFEGADWQAHAITPERACMQCLRQFKPADVSTEQAGLLEDPSYMNGLDDDHSLKRNENIFPFSMNLASLEVLQLVEMVTGIAEAQGDGNYGSQRYVYNTGHIRLGNAQCHNDCLYKYSIALGDTFIPLY